MASKSGSGRVMRVERGAGASGTPVFSSDDRAALLIATALDAIVCMDGAGCVVEWNPAAEALFGFVRSEVLGRPLAELIVPPHLRRAHREGLARYLATGVARLLDERVELPAVCKDGSGLVVELTVTRLPDAAPLFVGYLRDITLRRRQEQALRFVADASRELATSLDLPTTLSRLVRLAVPELGECCMVDLREDEADPDAPTSTALAALAHREPREGTRIAALRRGHGDPLAPLLAQALETASPVVVSSGDGEHRDALAALAARRVIVVPLVGRRRVLGALTLASAEAEPRLRDAELTVAVDVAQRAALAIDNAQLFEATGEALRERDAALEQAREAESLLQAVLDHAPSAIFVKALDGRYRLVNKACAALFARRPHEVVGLDDAALHPESPALVAERRASDQQALAADHAIEFDEATTLDGEPRTWLVLKFPLRDAAGRPYALGGIATDITARRRLNEARERFVGVLGHDLRNPLSAITLAASLLLRSGELSERHAKMARQITSSAERMTRLIQDVLDLTRGRLGGGIPIAPRPTDLADICRRALAELEVVHPERHFSLEVDGDPAGSWDEDRIAQVVSNLFTNALVHGRADGRVEVRIAATHPEELHLEVRNAADGCPSPEQLETLFEPFRRDALRNGAASEQGGLGLGLYIAWEIVRSHGGEIEVRCSAAEGFIVDVRLPRVAVPAE